MVVRRGAVREMAMARLAQSFLKDESGGTAIEYAMIASLISTAIVVVLVAMGPRVAALIWPANAGLN
jgi:Flp pilus assembly pilin Flp